MSSITKEELALWKQMAQDHGKTVFNTMCDFGCAQKLAEASVLFPDEYNKIRDDHERAETERLTKLLGK